MKHFRINGKKGVSPLIATVLLIAFAVALGAVVMNWGQSFTKSTMDSTETTQKTTMGCSFDVSIKEVEIAGESQICYNASSVTFLIRNNGNKDLTGLDVQIIGKDGVANTSIISPLLKGRVIRDTVDFSDIGAFNQLIITPIITLSGNEILCSDQSIIRADTEIITPCP